MPNSLDHLLQLLIPKPDIAKEISISLFYWRHFATETVCLVITLCTFAELLLPISFDNLVLHLPKPCHFAMITSNALSNTLVRFKIIICLLKKNIKFIFMKIVDTLLNNFKFVVILRFDNGQLLNSN